MLTEAGKQYMREHYPDRYGIDGAEHEIEPPPTEPPDEPDKPHPHLRDRLLSLEALGQLPPSTPLINGLIYRNTTAQLSAGPGSYKTFMAIAMSCCVASKTPFGEHDVPERGLVVIVASEGAHDIYKRVLAWCEVWDVDPGELHDWLIVLPSPIQLGDRVDVSQTIDVVTELNAAMLVLDTRARCTLGLEENSATEQGLAIAAVDRIRAAAGTAVLGVHHTPRAGNAGRGSNAWDGAIWSDLRVEGSNLQAKIHCEKHKDVASGCDHHFVLRKHTVSQYLLPGVDPMDRETLVLCPTDTREMTAKLTTARRAVVGIVWDLAPPEGFAATDLIDIAQVSKSRLYDATTWGLGQGYLRNAGTLRRSRWVPGKTRPPWLPTND
jgi:AAA domain-containing protein